MMLQGNNPFILCSVDFFNVCFLLIFIYFIHKQQNKTIQYNKSYIEWFCFWIKSLFFTNFIYNITYCMVYLNCKHNVYVNILLVNSWYT